MANYKRSTTRETCVCCNKWIWFERNVVDKTVVIEPDESRTQLIACYTMHKRCAGIRWLDYLNEHPEVREIDY